MDIRKSGQSFIYRGTKFEELWPGSPTFSSGDRGVRNRGPVRKIKTDSEVTRLQVFGQTVEGDKVPVVEIFELSYSGVPEQPYIVEYSIDGRPAKNLMTSELVSPEVIRENPKLEIKFRALMYELQLEGQKALFDKIGRLLYNAKT